MLGLRVVDAESGELIGSRRTLVRLAIIIGPLLLLVLAGFLPSFMSYYGGFTTYFWFVGIAWTLMLLFAGLSGKGAIHDWATRSTVTLTR